VAGQKCQALQAKINMMDIDQLTYAINGAVFEVNRILGPGFLEKVYENALLVELEHNGIKAQAQAPIRVTYKEAIVGDYIADILVDDRVIVELKTVERIERIHEAQLLNYLKATGIKVGLLVNFKNTKAEIKRLVLDYPEKGAVEK
jgi:GxxExxY protein